MMVNSKIIEQSPLPPFGDFFYTRYYMIDSIITFLTLHGNKILSITTMYILYTFIINQITNTSTLNQHLSPFSILFTVIKETSWLDFKANILPKMPIANLAVSNNNVVVHLAKNPYLKYTFTVASHDFLNNEIEKFNLNVLNKSDIQSNLKTIPVSFSNTAFPTTTFINIIKIVVITGFFIMIRARTSTRSTVVSHLQTPNYEVLKPLTTLDDVVGAEVKMEVMDLVDILMNPDRYAAMGAKTPKGILLEGPPGTGKTMLARAVANYSNATLYYISAASLNQTFVGVGSNRLVDLFTKAKMTKPSIIFIDELDAIGKKRGARVGFSNDDRESTLNTMLTLMDGFESNEGTLVIAATNRKSILDDALLRPGRFDRAVTFELPNSTERYQMFVKLLNDMPCGFANDTIKIGNDTIKIGNDTIKIDNDTIKIGNDTIKIGNDTIKIGNDAVKVGDDSLYEKYKNSTPSRHVSYKEAPIKARNKAIEHYSKELGKRTMGMSGADIAKVINEAIIHAAKSQKEAIDWDDLNFALDYTSLGPMKRMKIISDEQKRIVAYHETGHALVAYLLPCATNPTKVSIVPRGNSMLGFSQSVPEEEKKLFSKQEMLDHMHVLIAGRVAERIKFNSITTGASDDLERLTRSARELVMRYGMDDQFGSMVLLSDHQYSNETLLNIDKQVQTIIATIECDVEALLRNNNDSFEAIATLLFEKETIVTSDIDKIIQ